MNIPLTEEDRILAEELATETYQKYKDYSGHYRNLKSSHHIGRYGEIGAHKYFKELGMKCEAHYLFPDEDHLCDLTADGTRWDIKTWNTKYWQVWGRAVSTSQLAKLEAKADAILWASVYPLTALEVTIYGWNYVDDIKRYDPEWMGPGDNKVHNYQVPMGDIRPLSDIKK